MTILKAVIAVEVTILPSLIKCSVNTVFGTGVVLVLNPCNASVSVDNFPVRSVCSIIIPNYRSVFDIFMRKVYT